MSTTPGYVSNSDLAQRLSKVVDRWNTRENQMISLLTQEEGTVVVTDGLGVNHTLPSFPQLQKEVKGMTDDLTGSVAQVREIATLVTGLSVDARNSANDAADSAEEAAATADSIRDIETTTTSHRDAAAASAAAAETSAGRSSVSATNAASSAGQAATSATAAAGSATAANTSKTAAATSATSANTAKTGAETARTAAQAAQTAAETALASARTVLGETTDVADLVEADAAAAAASATAAAGSASTAAAQAATAKNSATTASTKASEAAGSATTAANHASAASGSAAAASTSAQTASSAKTAAEAARDKANLYANAPAGTEVSSGEYSAKHWAAQAQAAATGSLIYMGSWDASTGKYPANPVKGHFYKVIGEGTISGLHWRVGDQALYGVSWEKIDNTDQVSSVAGKQGDVTLVAGDIGGLGALATRNDVDFNTQITGKPSTYPPSTHTHSKAQVGLDKVDNTADLAKPISAAAQAALDTKAAADHTHAVSSMTDVSVSAPANGQVLKWNSTTGMWTNQADSNTTYSAASLAELQAGTATTGRLVPASVLKGWGDWRLTDYALSADLASGLAGRVERGTGQIGADGIAPSAYFTDVSSDLAFKYSNNTTGSTGFPSEFGATLSVIMARQQTRSFDLFVGTNTPNNLWYRGYSSSGNTPGDWKLIASTSNANTWTARQTFNEGWGTANNKVNSIGAGGGTLRGTDTGSVVLSSGGNTAGLIFFRPNGDTATDGQATLSPSGQLDAKFVRSGGGGGDGATLLSLYGEREWVFKQVGSAATSALELTDNTGGKRFQIGSISNSNKITFDPNASQVSAVEFKGKLTGNADSATTADSAATATSATTAGSATTLTTARTINGTSFNGSASITTANWGTARNLTIGSTAKSVNGSANVAWTLAEIGAAAASHSHAIADVSGLQAALDAKAGTAGATFSGQVVLGAPAPIRFTGMGAAGAVYLHGTNGAGDDIASITRNNANSSYNLQWNGAANFSSRLTVGDQLYLNGGWFRSQQSGTGWYHEAHGGGWFMQDNTWVRNYGSKRLLIASGGGSDGDVRIESYAPTITCYDTDSGTTHWLHCNDNNHGFLANNAFSWCAYRDASNNWVATGNIVAYASDVRLKKNIVDASATKVTDFFDRFRVREFDWNPEAIAELNPTFNPASEHEIGGIAQEAEDVYSLMVATHGNGIKTIQWEKAVPLLIAEVQSLRKRLAVVEGGA